MLFESLHYQSIWSAFLFLDEILPYTLLRHHTALIYYFVVRAPSLWHQIMSDIFPVSSLSLPSYLSHFFYLFKKKIIQDTLKKRMQVQVLQNTLLGVGSIPQYDNVWHCIRKTYSSKQAIFYCVASFGIIFFL